MEVNSIEPVSSYSLQYLLLVIDLNVFLLRQYMPMAWHVPSSLFIQRTRYDTCLLHAHS